MKNRIIKNSLVISLFLLFSLTVTAVLSPEQPDVRSSRTETNVRNPITIPCLSGNCGKSAFDNGASVQDMAQWDEHRNKIFGSDEDGERSESVDSL